MVAPAFVPGLEHPTVPAACQAPCACRAGGRSPKPQPAERLAANLRAQMSCCQRPAQGACVAVQRGCWDAWPWGGGYGTL